MQLGFQNMDYYTDGPRTLPYRTLPLYPTYIMLICDVVSHSD